jgi:hypothetical protein
VIAGHPQRQWKEIAMKKKGKKGDKEKKGK